jgi:hypothetical protein
MHPVVAPTVPGAAVIVAAPVIADAERDDADSQARAELKDRHAAVLVVVVEIVPVDPAAVAFPIHVAPSPIIEATVHVQ